MKFVVPRVLTAAFPASKSARAPIAGERTVVCSAPSRAARIASLIFAAVLAPQAAAQQPDSTRTDYSPTANAEPLEEFALADFRGKQHRLSDYPDKPLIVLAFLGTECPLAKLYAPRLVKLAADYEARGVVFLGINSNSQDSLTKLAAYARTHQLNFPLLKDTGNRVADLLGAQRTPEVFLLDTNRRIQYQGRIDDQYGVGYVRDASTREDLRQALDELLAGKPVSQPAAEAVGCHIGRIREPQPDSPVTYSNQIARIFQRHCVECHRPGEIAPFSLTDVDEVVGWSETIEEVIREQRMPPWHADPQHGRFVNPRIMTDEEKQTIFQWVAAGSPEGDATELPEPVEYVTGWRLSKDPDQVVAMRDRPFTVPAEGTVEYQYFVVDPGFTEDKWVHAAEVIPGNRSVVHHAIVFFRAPEGVEQRGLGWLTAYVPGQSSFESPSSQARFVPAGSKFVFQMHYTPTGSPQQDLTRIGLIFSEPEQVEEELLTLVAINHHFEIPPHAANFQIDAVRTNFPAGAKLLAIAPHMHVRGKAFRAEVVAGAAEGAGPTNFSFRGPESIEQKNSSPAKTEIRRPGPKQEGRQTLLNVPHYDFNWQHAYALAQPLPLNKDTRIECSAWYDNSVRNLVNPDPSATVRWGDQTWEEMMIAFLEISVPVDRDRYRGPAEEAPLTAAQLARAAQIADDLIRRFDTNGDGVVHRDEVPEAFAVFAFNRIDVNRDRRITREEALDEAIRSIRRKANGTGL